MKRVFLCLLIISMIVVFSFAGCKSEETEAVDEIEEVEETSAEEVADEDRDEKPHFTSDDGKIEFALDNIERTKVLPDEIAKIINTETPKKGYDFIVVNLTILRITDGHIYFREKDSTLVDNSGAEFMCFCMHFRGFTLLNTDPHDVSDARIEYSEGTQDTIVFEIPENAQPVKLKLAYVFFESWSESGQYQSEEDRYIDITLY